MRIEIIESGSKEDLQKQVNTFMRNSWLEVIGVEYQVYVIGNTAKYSCMVIYNEVQYEKSR